MTTTPSPPAKKGAPVASVKVVMPPKRPISLSRKTQWQYAFLIGGVLFLYSLMLIILCFYLASRSANVGYLYSEEFRAQSLTFTLVVGIGGLASLIIALVLVERFFKPFYQIKEKFIRLSHKNLTTRLDLIDNDDFQELSQEFNSFLDELERLVMVLRLEQEEVSMILLKAKKEAHLQSTKEILDKISRHSERIIEHLLAYRVLGDR